MYEREALKWILLLWGVWNIIAIVTLLIGSYRNDAIFALSANWFLRGYLMNIALPQLICILAAAAFVRASHKIAAGFLLILFLFLISPFREQIVWTKAEVPVIVQAWNAFQRLFHILYQNGEWGVDVQYGLQTESFRLQIELGWIAALWLFTGRRVDNKGKEKAGLKEYTQHCLCVPCQFLQQLCLPFRCFQRLHIG